MEANLVFIIKHEHEKGRIVDMQTHNCHELVFYDRGCNGTSFIAGVEHKFSAGDIAVNKRLDPHSEEHFSDGGCIFFGFQCNSDIQSAMYHNMWEVKPLIEAILKESIDQNYNYKEIISLKIQEILLLLERSRKSIDGSNRAKSLYYCKNYIKENYMQKIKIADLAEMTGYSTDHFRHLFHASFGISPQNYIIRQRCEKAIELLKNTTYKCTDIAYKCGFSDSGQMTKLINRIYQKTPQQIRREN